MSYCTRQNLIDRFGEPELIQLTDRDLIGIIDSNVLDIAIGDADAEINDYLTDYSLPLAVVPANLTRLACDIVRYQLYGIQPTKTVETRYQAAIRYLEQVASGKISLAADQTGTPPVPASNKVEFVSDGSVFGRALDGF